MRRLTLLAASAGFLAACADQPAPTAVSEPTPAPLLATGAQDQSLRDRYIVVFKPSVRDVDATVERMVREHGIGQVHYRYRAALHGFAASVPAQALEGLRRNPNVEFIEADGLASITAGTQNSPPSWGLNRVDERDLPMDGLYAYQNEGQNVEAYILDTGIRYTHQEFGGRAVTGRDFVDNDDLSQDCHGHGTHVAGTVGGSATGIAKQVKLVGVRVLNCSGSGSYAGIIGGVDWVTQQKQGRPTVPMVGNMSLGGGASSSLNTAVNNSVNAGVVWAVAAGNDYAVDACTKSPASAASALTVAASTSSDARASFSNIGSCVDLYAPGSGIYSSTYNGDNTYASWSGTSMASPHVAGVAALYLSANPTASGTTVNNAITGGATTGVITDAGTGTPNRLLYSLIAGGTVEPPPPPPDPVDIVVHVSDLDRSSAKSGKKFWKATVTIEVRNAAGALVAEALVTGSFSSGSGSCTTGSTGRCSIASGNISMNTASTVFTVANVTGTNLGYDASANGDGDGDSNGTTITVSKP